MIILLPASKQKTHIAALEKITCADPSEKGDAELHAPWTRPRGSGDDDETCGTRSVLANLIDGGRSHSHASTNPPAIGSASAEGYGSDDSILIPGAGDGDERLKLSESAISEISEICAIWSESSGEPVSATGRANAMASEIRKTKTGSALANAFGGGGDSEVETHETFHTWRNIAPPPTVETTTARDVEIDCGVGIHCYPFAHRFLEMIDD